MLSKKNYRLCFYAQTIAFWFCFSINRFFSACICPQHPQAKGTYLPSMHLDSWDSHPRVDLTQMPPSVATAHGSATASTLDLWLDISIIIPSACRGLRHGLRRSVRVLKTSNGSCRLARSGVRSCGSPFRTAEGK